MTTFYELSRARSLGRIGAGVCGLLLCVGCTVDVQLRDKQDEKKKWSVTGSEAAEQVNRRVGLVVSEPIMQSVYRKDPCNVTWSVPIGKGVADVLHQTLQRSFAHVDLVPGVGGARKSDLYVVVERIEMDVTGWQCGWGAELVDFFLVPLTLGMALFWSPSTLTTTVTLQLQVLDAQGHPVESSSRLRGKSAVKNVGIFSAGGDIEETLGQALAQAIREYPSKVQWMAKAMGPDQYLPHNQTAVEESPPENIDSPPTFDKVNRTDDVAVVIGIEDHLEKNITPATYAKRDAELVEKYLLAMHFQKSNIKILVNEKALSTRIQGAFETWLPGRVKPGSRVIVYFSGHGTIDVDKDGSRQFLVAYDLDLSRVGKTAISLAWLYEQLGKLPAKEVTVILDACFSGAGGRSVVDKNKRPLVIKAPVNQPPANVAILSAAKFDQKAGIFEQASHGLFTYYVVKAIRDGEKTLGGIYQNILSEVENRAMRLDGSEQSPTLEPNPQQLAGRFALR